MTGVEEFFACWVGLLAASLLTNEKGILNNVPKLSDIEKMKNILKHLGVKLNSDNANNLIINSKNDIK